VCPENYSVRIAVDGEMHTMTQTEPFKYAYAHTRTGDSHRLCYYYEAEYNERTKKGVKKRLERSKVHSLLVINRYVIGFESNRGLPGMKGVLLGRGFEVGDQVKIDGVACDTTFISPNSLEFIIPIVEKPGEYHACLVSDNGDIGLGDFCVDPIKFKVNLSSIDLATHEKQILVVTTDFDAPEGGILIEATTNVPDSIVMGDIFIPAGARSASVVIQGAMPSVGMLYLTAEGFEELKIPVEVVSNTAYYDSLESEDDEEFAGQEFLTL
jgi:hypothetical protein